MIILFMSVNALNTNKKYENKEEIPTIVRKHAHGEYRSQAVRYSGSKEGEYYALVNCRAGR